MSQCGFCNKELKVTFICPYCRKPYCSEHRKPENHNCSEYSPHVTLEENHLEEMHLEPDYSQLHQEEEDILEESIEKSTDYEDIIQDDTEDTHSQHSFDSEIYDNTRPENLAESDDLLSAHTSTHQPIFSKLVDVKTPLVIIIIVTLVLGTLIGMTIDSNNAQTNLQQRYDTLNEYYQDLQSQNQNITKELEDINNEFNLLENQLNQTQQELSNLQQEWDKVFSDQTTYIKPTVNQLRTWLASDQTDKQTISKEYTSLNQAIQLSMKAKTQGWKFGIITVYGNYTNNKSNNTYNIIKINDDSFEDALVFIDPQTDFIWWNPNFVTITPEQVLSLGEYPEVYITEVNVILEP